MGKSEEEKIHKERTTFVLVFVRGEGTRGDITSKSPDRGKETKARKGNPLQSASNNGKKATIRK